MNTHMHTHVYTHRDEGVWFPDGIQLQLAWSGSGSAADSYKESSFNPFADIPEPLVARSFVEDLDCDAESLQWWVGFGLGLLHARLWKIWTAMPSPCSGGSVLDWASCTLVCGRFGLRC